MKPTVGDLQSRLNGEATWTARNNRAQGLAHPVITTCVSSHVGKNPVKR
jgi:S-adenosylmethionine synthetase